MIKLNTYIAKIIAITFASVLFTAHAAKASAAEDISGVVKNSGSPGKRKTSIVLKSGPSPVHLCEEGQRFAIAQLPGVVVTVAGHFRSEPNQQNKCFHSESFKILEIAPGRPAIVGQLKLVDKDSYAIVSSEGRTWKLASLAPGLKNLVGNTVISDLIAERGGSSETRWLVVRIFSHP